MLLLAALSSHTSGEPPLNAITMDFRDNELTTLL
jgi:hypothetical protein